MFPDCTSLPSLTDLPLLFPAVEKSEQEIQNAQRRGDQEIKFIVGAFESLSLTLASAETALTIVP